MIHHAPWSMMFQRWCDDTFCGSDTFIAFPRHPLTSPSGWTGGAEGWFHSQWGIAWVWSLLRRNDCVILQAWCFELFWTSFVPRGAVCTVSFYRSYRIYKVMNSGKEHLAASCCSILQSPSELTWRLVIMIHHDPWSIIFLRWCDDSFCGSDTFIAFPRHPLTSPSGWTGGAEGWFHSKWGIAWVWSLLRRNDCVILQAWCFELFWTSFVPRGAVCTVFYRAYNTYYKVMNSGKEHLAASCCSI